MIKVLALLAALFISVPETGRATAQRLPFTERLGIDLTGKAEGIFPFLLENVFVESLEESAENEFRHVHWRDQSFDFHLVQREAHYEFIRWGRFRWDCDTQGLISSRRFPYVAPFGASHFGRATPWACHDHAGIIHAAIPMHLLGGRGAVVFDSETDLRIDALLVGNERLNFLSGREHNVGARNAQVGAGLGIADLSSYLDSVLRGLGSAFSFADRRTGGCEGFLQEPHGPSAYKQRNEAKEGHRPLRPTISEKTHGERGALALLALFVAIGGGTLIMFVAGRFSWANFGVSRLRFYGGLCGGLFLVACWLCGWVLWGFLPIAQG